MFLSTLFNRNHFIYMTEIENLQEAAKDVGGATLTIIAVIIAGGLLLIGLAFVTYKSHQKINMVSLRNNMIVDETNSQELKLFFDRQVNESGEKPNIFLCEIGESCPSNAKRHILFICIY